MLKVDNIQVAGFEPAIRGMRNPMNSWSKSDTKYAEYTGLDFEGDPITIPYVPPRIGSHDLTLMRNLFRAGTEHRKYLRMVQVWLDITAPLYWWKEFDTYKLGTVGNSCSTMHKIHDKPFTIFDFSVEHLSGDALMEMVNVVNILNQARNKFLKTENKNDWWQMIQLLPSSYNQKRTILMNYEVIARIIEQRTGHKLDEWQTLINELKKLPYVKDVIV